MTIVLGVTFLICTGKEWHELIFKDGLTISRNLFGSTYFTLVGFHALHVTIGLIILSSVLLLALAEDGWPSNITKPSKSFPGTGTSSTACGSSCFRWSI